MEINCGKLKKSLFKLRSANREDNFLTKYVRLSEYGEKDVEKIANYLAQKLLEPEYTELIAHCFPDILLILVILGIPIRDENDTWEIYQKKCVALSKLTTESPEILRYAIKYFSGKPAPFRKSNEIPSKKSKTEKSIIIDLDIVKCCYNLLSSDPAFYKDQWDWSIFVELYFAKGTELQQLYYNYVVSILCNMTASQLKQLNENIPENILLTFYNDANKKEEVSNIDEGKSDTSENNKIYWNFSSNIVTNIEGVLLPIYNNENANFYSKTDGNYDKIVKVDSTKVNLRSIALGISSGKAVCLSGPVGCGKTTLIEYLARKTGRIVPKKLEVKQFQVEEKSAGTGKDNNRKENLASNQRAGNQKRKIIERKKEVNGVLGGGDFESNFLETKNGFLRIQLGDQTDSKMLLGQYRCTDVPGEFIWLPGVLTQAVMNGYWLLLEDLDSATQDTCSILSSLLENNYLSVPGFRDCLKIEPGFQLFVTVRSQKSFNSSQKTTFSLLEKYLYTVNILPLSRTELCQIVSANYPRLETIATRIVDVFLTFSSGDHNFGETLRNATNDNSGTDYTVLPTSDAASIATLPNSGRLVSTRDLMKLCQRSYSMYSVTSSECAYFIFQNAVDVFCSYLPHGTAKTNLITSIGARLGIIQSRCEFFAKDYKPDVEVDRSGIKVGRAQLDIKGVINENPRKRGSDDDGEKETAVKKTKTGSDTENISFELLKSEKKITFSYTRLTCCLLERIAVCVNQNEPILLVGETGVGKTSSVQYLAAKTNHKLVVVNMNNQSDVSDLVGGFKPVDLSYVMAPVRCEFELLFRKTFNENKNEKFLSNISICYNRGDFSVLIKLMIRITDTVFKRAQDNDLKMKNLKSTLNDWKTLQLKLFKLNSQLNKSINISFAFITGSLVNCIKHGDWVLLDEINLASAETLECLSTILEPDGSIVLLEKGDLTPIERHPEFRIFSCMNPNTDIGKKDLPIGIRNRFTEFFVDELTSESDLRVLVGDYLSNTGIKNTKVLDIVKLYKKLKALSQIDLNDGLGNRPVFSLRTLCRSLMICAKNLCGSVERNLYESFCLSFLTQLDNDSHKVVLELIKAAMLSNVKAILSQQIPKPGEDYLNFEGYWIQQGPKELMECSEYILTDNVRQNLKDLARIVSIGKLPILLQGPTSAGKTSLIEYVAKKSGNHCLRINNHEHTDLQEYIGTYTSDVTGKLIFKEGVLVQAMRNGFWIILDELNLASTDILEALNRVLDDNRELFIPETQAVVKAHPNFMLFATQNPPGLYGGRKTLSRAFKNRFIELHFSEIPKPELEIILEKRCLIPKSYSQKMVKCMSELQVNRKSTSRNNFTLRDLFRWGNRYTFADKKLLENNSYDWNQHLVDEGYLVLSAKVRTEVEVEIIEETLFHNFRKKINLDNLYSLNESTSLVTKEILESVFGHTHRSDIIWTQNMTRMAVLTAKALQFNEPVLLVGPTGCGKTTVCQILSNIKETNLRILNCHMHTEGADFLGGLRPCRKENDNSTTDAISRSQLFEWADGPLIHSMQDGSFFMADEISLAEDSVLERLNSVLEPSRIILLAEKGGVNSNVDSDALNTVSKEFIIHAAEGFQFLATMNPGGDFGKKELSPALRNRFTEVWCKPSDAEDDLIKIADNTLKLGLKNSSQIDIGNVAKTMIKVVFYLKNKVDKFKFSVRDILAWANYLNANSKNSLLNFEDSLLYGLEIIFLDSLEMLPHESEENIEKIKNTVIRYALDQIKSNLEIHLSQKDVEAKRGTTVTTENGSFGIKPFFIEMNPANTFDTADFFFNAPTTKRNLLRLLSALSLNKAVLLEGPPGVGKTSIVENLAHAVGYKIVRINLCEHTDLADLFGTDLPAEEKALDIDLSHKDSADLKSLGSFVWRDGPLLAALKSENTWILLDELNLAPQSVLEGLNAILDHRGEVFIPELNKTFILGKQTRIFACQNPLRQGGGRKGLPQSFLNRFTKVYLRKLNTDDLLHVVNGIYHPLFDELEKYFGNFFKYLDIKSDKVNVFNISNSKSCFTLLEHPQKVMVLFDLPQKMVKFSEILDKAVTDLEFGYKGGPFEINLRDILRWCELLSNPKTGFMPPTESVKMSDTFKVFRKTFENFLLVVYERMKLVYYQRMRSDSDKLFIQKVFGEIFQCDAEKLNAMSEDVGIYWTDSELFLNDVVLNRNGKNSSCDNTGDDNALTNSRNMKNDTIMLSCQSELLKNVVECVHMEKPVILSGPTDSGKTKIIDVLCSISNQYCDVEIIEDSVTGSFQQIDLNRHLEEISQNIESVYTRIVQSLVLAIHSEKLNKKLHQNLVHVLKLWTNYSNLSISSDDAQKTSAMSDELVLFKNRIQSLNSVIEKIKSLTTSVNQFSSLENLQTVLNALKNIVKNSDTLNTGGHFEWVDSKIVKALKQGRYISLEHVNLCSSAILDRLNPVFEPNGNLLLSEKGITVGEESEIVHKHRNFRAFLTIDPKHGELSRAMRNRCVELDLSKNNYSEDDLRRIVFINGVTENYLIDTVVSIFHAIKSVSELNNFNISHLIHCAFLVACNKRIGLSDDKAIYISALEVYVYSSTTDLLGFGLDFYQTKLRDIVIEECKLITPTINVCNLNNVIIRSKDLTMMSMIKMQCEPLVGILKCYPNSADMKDAIGSVFIDLKELQFENGFKFIKYYIYMLYELSTACGMSIRNKYINTLLNSVKNCEFSEAENNELLEFNNNLFAAVKSGQKMMASYDSNIPWNTMLMPRIRNYYSNLNSESKNELRLSAQLLANLLLSTVTDEKITKLSKITAIGYSQAIALNKATDNFNNALLKQLNPFLNSLATLLCSTLQYADMGIENYVQLALSNLWINRLYDCSKQKLLIEKNLDTDLIDKLLLHFKWLDKNFLKLLEQMLPNYKQLNQKFETSITKIRNYSLSVNHPLNLIRKMFFKQMISFVPYYSKEQIAIQIDQNRIDEMTGLIPTFGSHDVDKLRRIFRAMLSSEADAARNLLSNDISILSKYMNKVDGSNMESTAIVPEEIRTCVMEYFENINLVDQSAVKNCFEFNELMEKLELIYNTKDDEFEPINCGLDLQILPLKDYFATKAMILSNLTTNQFVLNEGYFETIPTYHCTSRKLLQILSNENYKQFKEMWQMISTYVENIADSKDFESLVAFLSSTHYRNFSTLNRIIVKILQQHSSATISARNDIFSIMKQKGEISYEVNYNGPTLMNSLFSLLCQYDGNLKPIGLGDLNEWRKTLNDMRQIVWNNAVLISEEFDIEKHHLNSSLAHAQKLLLEVEHIQKQCHNLENQNFSDYNENFQKLTDKLKSARDDAKNTSTIATKSHPYFTIQQQSFYSALLNSLIGAVELCLFSFTPLIDPVEKNRLKNNYTNEDLSTVNSILTAYDCMKIVMRYKGLGNETYNQFKSRIMAIENKREKLAKKVALRPEICVYSKLVQDINHFLKMNSEPQTLLALILNVEECMNFKTDFRNLESHNTEVSSFLLKSVEAIKKLDLWITNSQRFLFDVTKKYSIYYKDFTEPIECAIVMVRTGFEGLKCVLTQFKDSFYKSSNGIFYNINDGGKIYETIKNISQFPRTRGLQICSHQTGQNLAKTQSTIFTVLGKMENSELAYFKLLKSKVLEIKNNITIASMIEEHTFRELQTVYNICNQIWQDEEERRRKRQIEEESLYVNKTRCETENEDEIELLEIHKNFPTYVQEDFGEFVVEETLEQVIKLKKDDDNKKPINLIDIEDYKLIGHNFILIMERFAKLYYYKGNISKNTAKLDYITPFKTKISVFTKLVSTYKTCLNSLLDSTMYNTYGFIIGLQQDMLSDISISEDSSNSYNFYKDSNIPEIISCTELMDKIETRTKEQQALYPDHAVLIDIIRVIEKIRSLPSTSSIVRFNTGFQILRQKISQWNEVAHKNNHLRDLEEQVAEFIQKWTKLELQFWRNCLSYTFEGVQNNAYKYWFFIYNLLHEYLDKKETGANYADYKKTEKHFEENEIATESGDTVKSTVIRSADIIAVLRQFIENSNYADFSIRMRLLRSFEFYLHYVETENVARKKNLIAILRNIQIYFGQFTQEIDDAIKAYRTPIEKKLRDFVKIESYNKDLSYFSMRNNIARVHRNLNKFLKEYEYLLKNKISSIFQQKENTSQDYNLDNDKGINLRYEAKHKYYMIDVKNFMASLKLKRPANDTTAIEEDSETLLGKSNKLFTTARSVVRESITNTQFSSMIYSLDCLLTDQIETCEYLRKLEVDRSQEKPKQKMQAKHILSQKRKGLSDLYKTLENLGVNYKTGLMELSLKSDFTDFKIAPFCVRTMFSKHKKLDQNLIYLNENLDLYFAKCVFKLKLLQNVMLTPNAELGSMNIDRMKGFSVDMFILIQDQRKALSKSIKELYDLRKKIADIVNLVECDSSKYDAQTKLNFDDLENKYSILKTSFCEILSVVEQFILLFKCMPDRANANLTVLNEKDRSSLLVKSDPKYNEIMERLEKICADVKKSLQDIAKYSENEFMSIQKILEFEVDYKEVVESIETVKNEFIGRNGEYLPTAKPLMELLNNLEEINEIYSLKMYDDSKIENIEIELENIIHSILISLQKIYKKYMPIESDEKYGEVKTKSPDKTSEPENPIYDKHLKEKIHNNLVSDLDVLHLSSVVSKLSNVLLAVKYTGNTEDKANYIQKLVSILPILEQFNLMGDYYLFQQLGAHKVSTKMLSIMLTVFVEFGTKGFCIPPDLMQDEEGESKKNDKGGEGFGLEDGSGENDVSDKIESEDQLDDAKRPEDRKDNDQKKEDDCKEEKGIDMSEDFEGNMQDIDKNQDENDSDKEDNDEEVDKQMGETEEGAEKLDDQIWGSDEENEQDEEENEMSEEEEGKGSKDEEDSHNDLAKQNDAQKGDDNEQKEDGGLDATDDNDKSNKEKKKQNDIDNMKEPDEGDDDQVNPYHNELEEPPEPEEMDLDECNLDEENQKDGDDQQTENPFDIDKMKETMDLTEEMEQDEEIPEEESKDENADQNDDDSDSEPEPEAGMKRDEENPPEEVNEEQEEEQTEDQSQVKDDVKDDGESPEEPDPQEKPEDKVEQDYAESKDKTSKEENVQSVQEKEKKGSNDQVVNENDTQIEQDSNMDEQDTGEEKEGVGQAENDTSERGHQGIADTKQTRTDQEKDDKKNVKERKQQGNINEERTLGDADKNQIKQLKTIDKLKDNPTEDQGEEEKNPPMESDEYQHVREAKKTDSTTLDSATEEQSKQVQHLADEDKDEDAEEENTDELMEIDEPEKDDIEIEEVPDLEAEKTEQSSKKPSKSEKTKEVCETTEKMEVEGDLTDTYSVRRDDSTSAHCIKEILTDYAPSQEPTTTEILDLRRMYQNDLTSKKPMLAEREDFETWQSISDKMMPNARELCEQLRLILEPTKCTRLKGDYRTGRRINMKKIIPYIASQFRKDKIWLRRTKPSQRDYKITIAIDDSKSMHHNNSKNLTLQAISLVSQALTLLESGKLSIMSFGESPHIILNHTEQFDGPKLVKGLEFAQNQSRIAELLDFVRTANAEEGFAGSNGIFENLLLILSDGRNIFSEGEQKVKNAVKLARLQRIFLVYIIIDNPENKHSILDIRVPQFSIDRKSITMKSYLDGFPFPYYVIVRDLGQLPIVLSEAMRQWFELVNSEQ